MAFKPEILQQILSDAGEAEKRPVPGMKNVYTPEDYNLVMAKKRAMGMLDDGQSDGYYHSRVEEGEVEFDEMGRLKKIGRTQPKMIDLNRYCANRYLIDRVTVAQTKTKGLDAGTYIVCVFGEAIVNAINATTELPASVKAFRFRKTTVEGEVTQEMIDQMTEEDKATAKIGDKFTTTYWKYEKSEFLPKEEVYKMTKRLSNMAALELMHQIQDARVDSGDNNVDGDELDAIA